MDPNANLKEQLAIAKRILATKVGEEIDASEADRLAELVEALDEWLVSCGALPQRWQED